MTADFVMRSVAVVACATTLSLFSTIVAVAAVNLAPLKWDGSLCAARACGSDFAGLRPGVPKRAAALRAHTT